MTINQLEADSQLLNDFMEVIEHSSLLFYWERKDKTIENYCIRKAPGYTIRSAMEAVVRRYKEQFEE